ncbi:MAG: hypothetical protein K9N34_02275 [Candidatus Marinimicrobia bacterium]|nr:hypothetical protein [Candidatus Neomarinimicrobiota bacterium]MCF7839686.1 hypothetical protein [Candidatus Neomarinimicrobiota bacterium]
MTFGELHPFFVHFPIALMTVAALFDVLGLFINKTFFPRVGFTLLLVTTVLAIVVGLSGYAAEADLEENIQILAAVADNLTQHATAGNLAVWLIVALGLFRLWSVLERKVWAFQGWIFPVLSLLLALWVIYTGFMGGQLVRAVVAAYQAMI